jgi:hypothetical protein
MITMIDMVFPDRYSKGSIHFNPLALWERGLGERS